MAGPTTLRMPIGNRLLAALPATEYEALLPNLQRVHLPLDTMLYQAGDRINYAYFPISGMTSLLSITEDGHTETVRSLLAHGASTDMAEGRQTALMFATQSGSLEIVKLLLAAGADVNAKESHHMTALMWAAERGHIEIVQALLAAGADVHATNIDGYTALDIAGLVNQRKIVSLLEAADSSD
jgi:ankyrin repeat protein